MAFDAQGYEIPEERPGFFSRMGSFLLTALKWAAGIALIITGLVLFSDKAANMVDDLTGDKGKGNGLGTKIRETVLTAKETAAPTVETAAKAVGLAAADTPSTAEKAQSADNDKLDKLGTVGTGAVGLSAVAAAWQATKFTAGAFFNVGKAVAMMPVNGVRKLFGATPITSAPAAPVVTGPGGVPMSPVGPLTPVNAPGLSPTFAQMEQAIGLSGQEGFLAKSWSALGNGLSNVGNFLTSSKVTSWAVNPIVKVATPLLKPIGWLGKKLPAISATITVIDDGGHVDQLIRDKKYGTALQQTLGTGAEVIGMFAGAPGILIGTTVKELSSLGSSIVNGQSEVTHSMLGNFVGQTLGVEKGLENMWAKVKGLEGLEAQGRALDETNAGIMERSAAKRMNELHFTQAHKDEAALLVQRSEENHRLNPQLPPKTLMTAIEEVTQKHQELAKKSKEIADSYNQRQLAKRELVLAAQNLMSERGFTETHKLELSTLLAENTRAHRENPSQPRMHMLEAVNLVIRQHPELGEPQAIDIAAIAPQTPAMPNLPHPAKGQQQYV